MNQVIYRYLKLNEIKSSLFKDYSRYQQVNKCWRKIEGKWQLINLPFVEEWGLTEFLEQSARLRNTLESGGLVLGAFIHDTLIGFSSLENEIFGAEKYILLSSIHVSSNNQRQGVGKALLQEMSTAARKKKANKLYISAHSSEETIAFYCQMGCEEAHIYNQAIFDLEPSDCQLELKL